MICSLLSESPIFIELTSRLTATFFCCTCVMQYEWGTKNLALHAPIHVWSIGNHAILKNKNRYYAIGLRKRGEPSYNQCWLFQSHNVLLFPLHLAITVDCLNLTLSFYSQPLIAVVMSLIKKNQSHSSCAWNVLLFVEVDPTPNLLGLRWTLQLSSILWFFWHCYYYYDIY